MNTGIYVRVSSEEQVKHGYSIRAQIEKLTSYAKIKEWNISGVYEDKGISGKNIEDRPGINQLIKDIEKRKINNVLVFKIDRLTRSVRDLIELVDLFKQYNCEFNSLNESIDTSTATGRMFLKIIGIFAEFERENIVERTKVGFERKVREGYSLCTRVASYGYDKIVKDKIQHINIVEAEIVKEVFDMFVNQGLSFIEIAKNLNERNIPTKENALWYARTIKNMLTNCNYIGYVRYATKDEERNFEVKGVHEAIISEELYNEAQALISKISKKNYTKRPIEEHYFLGILVCAKCGAKFVTHGSYYKRKDGSVKVLGSYRCSNYLKRKKKCTSNNISHLKVEKAFENYIKNIQNFDIETELKNSNDIETEEKITYEYQQKLEKIRNKEEEITTLYVKGNIEFEDYTKMKKVVENEKIMILSQLDMFNNQKEKKDIIIKQDDIINNLKENWDLLNTKERRQFLIKFVDKIEVLVENNNPIIKKIEFHDF